jgi:ABC-type proline/glycine betaine transport system ATPase subunit
MKKSARLAITKNLEAYKQIKEFRKKNYGVNPPGVDYKPIMILIGPSGCAKTTSVKQICDMLDLEIWDTKKFDRKVRGEIFQNLVSLGEHDHR